MCDYYKDHGISLVPEFQFSPDRNYRWDFAIVPEKIAIEVQGGIWKGKRGGHTSGSGYTRDMAKSNLGVSLGWRILQCEPKDICMSDTLEIVQKTLEGVRSTMSEDNITLRLNPDQAAFLAGSILLMLKKRTSVSGPSKEHVQGVGKELLSSLAKAVELFGCAETEAVIEAAQATAQSLLGDLVISVDNLEDVVSPLEGAYVN